MSYLRVQIKFVSLFFIIKNLRIKILAPKFILVINLVKTLIYFLQNFLNDSNDPDGSFDQKTKFYLRVGFMHNATLTDLFQ